MAKGISVKVKSYSETVPKVLSLIKLNEEIKKHNKIVLKPYITKEQEKCTKPAFLEAVLRFCLNHKSPEAQIFIAEGSDGANTIELFEGLGYNKLSEAYSIGLVDLNDSSVKEMQNSEFLKFQRIMYPEILLDSFVISLPSLSEDPETGIIASLSNMLGAFPASYYKGFFSSKKSKIRSEPIKFAIHDILKCKMPDLAIIDSPSTGNLLVGQPIEMDKQAAKLLNKEINREIPYIRLVEESFKEKPKKEKDIPQSIS